jgi:hypothetical protein
VSKISPALEKLDKEINDELKSVGLPFLFKIKGLGPRPGVFLYDTSYYGEVSEAEKPKIKQKADAIIKKHFEKWRTEHFRGM